MKRLICTMICLVLAISMFSGCGADNKVTTDQSTDAAGSQSTDNSSDAARKVTLNFSYWDENQKVTMNSLIEDFQKENQNITIESTVVPADQYWTVLQASLPAGSGPDIFWLSGDHAGDLVPANLVLSLQENIEKDNVDISKFPEAIKQFYTFDGKLYGVPKDYDTIGIFYNKTLFDKAAVPYPKDGWTWDDLLDTAQKLTIKGEGDTTKQYGFVAARNVQSSVFNFIYQNGGQVYDEEGKTILINSPENIETLNFLRDLMFKYKVSPDGAEQKEIGSANMFDSEMAAMIPDGSWMTSHYYEVLGDKVDVVSMPKKQKQAVVIHGVAFAAAAKTEHPEEAWKFLKYLASQKAGEIQAGTVIPSYSGAESKFIDAYPTMNVKTFIDAASYSISYPFAYKNPDPVESALSSELVNIWFDKKDVATALADAEKNMNAELVK